MSPNISSHRQAQGSQKVFVRRRGWHTSSRRKRRNARDRHQCEAPYWPDCLRPRQPR